MVPAQLAVLWGHTAVANLAFRSEASVSPLWWSKSVPGHAAVDRHCPEFPVGIGFGEARLGKA